MAKKNAVKPDPVGGKLDSLIRVTQDLFILQALTAGMKVDDVRKVLQIDKLRVTRISRHIKKNEGNR